ncbi:MAG: Smr/MutS family protein [Pyrinomonadaceae bacterium]
MRIIHGKGIGVQRRAVREVLAASPLVIQVVDAPPQVGGLGATIAHLRPAYEGWKIKRATSGLNAQALSQPRSGIN